MGLGQGSGSQEGWVAGRMVPGQGCWRGLYWTLKAKGTWILSTRWHCLSADPSLTHSLELKSWVWRVSLAEPESFPSGWLSRGRDGALPTPSSAAAEDPASCPLRPPPPPIRCSIGRGDLQTGSRCALRQSKNDTWMTADVGGQTEKQQRRTRGTDSTDG